MLFSRELQSAEKRKKLHKYIRQQPLFKEIYLQLTLSTRGYYGHVFNPFKIRTFFKLSLM